MKADHLERIAFHHLRVECALCDWSVEGASGDVLAKQLTHRSKHGIKAPRQGHRANVSKIRQATLNDEERVEVDAEIARRKRLHGIEEAA